MSRRIILGLWIALDIPRRVHPSRIALHRVRRQEHARHRVIIPRVVVVQPRCIGILARKALVRPHAAALILLGAIGMIGLIAQQRSRVSDVAERGKNAPQGVGQEEIRLGR